MQCALQLSKVLYTGSTITAVTFSSDDSAPKESMLWVATRSHTAAQIKQDRTYSVPLAQLKISTTL